MKSIICRAVFSLCLLILCLAGIFLLSSCGSGGKIEEFSEVVYSPEEGKGFEILGAPGRQSVILRTSAPWQGANADETRDLLIVRGGEGVPEDFKGTILSEKAERIICMSSGHMAMIGMLDDSDKIVGGSNLDYVSSAEIQSRRGELMEVGYEGAIDYESLVACNPDLVILYGVNSANPMESKLDELGIPYVYIGDYLEESPLGKAEWVVAVGECLGKRKGASERFQRIRENYLAVKSRLDSIGDASRPKVMLNGPYGDQWMMPSADSYIVKLIADAGGDYLYPKYSGNVTTPISREEVLSLVSQADCWLNLGNDFKTLADVKTKLPLMASSGVVGKGALYNNTARSTPAGGNDFYESGIINPDLILRDMIKIMHPELVSEPFVYYVQLQ